MQGAPHFICQKRSKVFNSYFSPVRKISELNDPLIKSLISQKIIVAITKIKMKAPVVVAEYHNDLKATIVS